VKASGHLRITAPAGFGRRHVAPLVPRFLAQHPDVSLSLNLSDRVVDIVNEGFDCAVRVGDLPDSSLVSVRLADNRRLCVATPAYLQRAGVPHAGRPVAPRVPDAELRRQPDARLGLHGRRRGDHLRPSGRLDCSDGQVLHDWCLRGLGIAWRSTWEVEGEVAAGRLQVVLEDFAAPPNGIYAVFPQRKHLPLRVRLWIDFLKHSYGDPPTGAPAGSGGGRRRRPAGARALGAAYFAGLASASHFFMWLVLAAPASFLWRSSRRPWPHLACGGAGGVARRTSS
jgi:DNA-binding transcriptional LysR family regulator